MKTALAVLGIFIAAGHTAALAKGSPVFTVAKVAVEAEAKDAVEAKQIALTGGQQAALRTLLKRLTHASVYPRLPVLDDSMVERMIDGFSVRRESNSTTRYVATLDYSFEPDSVRDILNRFGLPFAEQQASPLVLLPVMTEGGGVKTGSGRWRRSISSIRSPRSSLPPRAQTSLPAQSAIPPARRCCRRCASNTEPMRWCLRSPRSMRSERR